jgi:vitamin B12 transporter
LATPGQSIGLQNFSSNLSWDLAAGEHWHNHLYGFESRNVQKVVDPQFGTFISKFNRAGFDEQLSYLFHNGTFTAGYEYEVENGPSEGRHNQAGYLEARYQFTERFSATAGGRVEANGKFGTRAVPRVGGVYLLRKGGDFWGATRVRSSYGLGIKEPELLPVDCSANLKPERSRTVNAGIEQLLGSDRVRISATYFNNRFYDIVSFDFTSQIQNCPAFGGSFFNTDLARASGANGTIETKPVRWLRIVGNYTYDDSKVLKSPNATDPALIVGNRLFKRPLHSASLIFNASLWRMNWNLAGNYVGRRSDSDFDSTIKNGVCTGPCITSNPSYVRWYLAAIIPLRYGLSATARVENLFDRHYEDAVGYPALRLNYRVGMKYVWGRE